jgi:hypothetical protein
LSLPTLSPAITTATIKKGGSLLQPHPATADSDTMQNYARVARGTLAGVGLVLVMLVGACAPGGGSAAAAPVLHTSADGGFQAEFPGLPERQQRNSTSSPDRVIVTYKAKAGTGEVAIAYADYPGRNLSLDRLADGIGAEIDGTVQSRTDLMVLGYPAVDLVVKTERGTVYERLVVRGVRMYTLIGTAGSGRPAAYDHLLNTFVLL